MRGGCYPPRLKAEVNNILRDLHNSSHHTKVEFNNCLLFIQNISKFLTSLPPRRLTFSGYKKILNLADTLQKVDKIYRVRRFAYSCIISIQFQPEIQLFCLRIALNFILFQFIVAQAASFPRIYHRLTSFLMPEMCLRTDDILLTTSSKYGKHKLDMKNQPGDWSPSETAKYFE